MIGVEGAHAGRVGVKVIGVEGTGGTGLLLLPIGVESMGIQGAGRTRPLLLPRSLLLLGVLLLVLRLLLWHIKVLPAPSWLARSMGMLPLAPILIVAVRLALLNLVQHL